MPTLTPNDNPDVLYNVGQSILTSFTRHLSESGLTGIPDRRYVGFGPEPPEECCPDIVVWADSPRIWDGTTFDSGFKEGRLLCTGLWAVDYHIRIGLCYPKNPEAAPPGELNQISQALYRVGHSMLFWACKLRSGNVAELQQTDSEVRPGTLRPYNQGGCAGWELVVTVGLQ